MRIGDCRKTYKGPYDVWKVTASQSDITVVEHPPWCGMEEFKEVMVSKVDPKNLCLVQKSVTPDPRSCTKEGAMIRQQQTQGCEVM